MRADVVFTQLADGTGALLDLATMEYFALNGTGCRIWELLQRVPEDAARALAAEYDLSEAEAEAEVAGFLDELRDAGLVER